MIDETVEEIEEMQTHSSSVVAVNATRALEELLDREFATVEEFHRDLERNSKTLRRANHSHASLQNALREVERTVLNSEDSSVDDAKGRLKQVIERVVDDVETGKGRAAEHAVSYLDDGMTILTHDYSSTVLEAIERAVQNGTYLDVYVTEGRPRYLGRRTARTLAEMDRVETTLVTDAASGHVMSDVDRVVTGMTCIAEDTLYNRVGTFPIAATADQVGVPMTVVGSGAKIIEEGFVFENEYRSGSEVMREPTEGFGIENPSYDATPVDLLTDVVTDEGRQDL
ncbi:translation initiation factor eIF-2B [Halostella sp. PRR32]|uniref:translation initiation factor eIF-2B n=1 Tax=Halostella sp. PRR32 TaxID=3098147 RepID=UPI00110D7780|nr:translation initiation factor eIF-2B [Halostella sp. PRR32]